MTDHHELDFDHVAAGFMADGPTQLADDVLDAVALEIHGLHQRRGTSVLRREPRDLRTWAALAAAVAIVGVGIVGVVGLASPRLSAPAGPQATADAAGIEQPSASHENLRMIAPYPGADLPGTISFTFDDTDSSGSTTWLMDPSGARAARLHVLVGWPSGTPTSQFDCCGVFSPDGQRIAMGYAEVNALRGPGSWQTGWIMNLDGTERGPVPPFCGGCGSLQGIHYVPRAWSPDGKLIAVEAWSVLDPTLSGIKLSPMGFADWDQATIGHRDVPIAFSPDSARLLFIRLSPDPAAAEDGEGDLMVLSIDSGELRQLNPSGTFVDDRRGAPASWSPDGTSIAFATTTLDVGATLHVVATAGGDPSVIVGPLPNVGVPTWSPDGQWLAFTDGDVHLVRPDGSGDRNLTAAFGHLVSRLAWSPDGTVLLAAAHTSGPLGSQLVQIPINGDPVRQITETSGTYTDLSWGPATR